MRELELDAQVLPVRAIEHEGGLALYLPDSRVRGAAADRCLLASLSDLQRVQFDKLYN